MSDLDNLFNAALKKPHASAVTEDGAVVDLKPETDEVTPVTQVTSPAEPAVQEGKGGHPWDAGNPRVISFFQIRMPEPLKMKIEFLASKLPGTGKQHKIALSALEREIDRMIAKELKAK